MEQNNNTGVPITPVVENKQKSRNGLKITTAIACIVAICGIGFGVYSMLQSSQKDSQISDLKVDVSDKVAEIGELETEISDLNSKIEEATVDTGATTTTISDTAEQIAVNNDGETAAILLGAMLDKNDSRAAFKIGDCTADGPSVKCPVTVNGRDALISYNSNDSILRLSLPND